MEQDVKGPEEPSGRCLPASDERVPSSSVCRWVQLAGLTQDSV